MRVRCVAATLTTARTRIADNPRMDDPPKLRFLLRRGMKELDVIVTRYHQNRYASAAVAERELFVRLLETVEDPDIWAWTMGYIETPAEYVALVEQLRVHR